LQSLAQKQEKMRQRTHQRTAPPIQSVTPTQELEFSVNEAAQLLGLSRWTVTRLFQLEPGVRIYGNEESTRNRRRQRTLRIPGYVLRRVQERHTVR
jgi:AraC-like DNA-binding protein